MEIVNERLKLASADGIIIECGFAEKMAENLKSIKAFRVKDDDIILVTYPKCGTTWMQYIVWGILNKGARPPNINEMMFHDSFPYLEITGTKVAETMKSPRPLKSHLPYSRVPRNTNTKYIYVIRNPFDTLISFYHFVLNTDPDIPRDVTLDEFFEYFMEGNVMYGDYFDHILGWYDHKDDENLLFLSYEDMTKDHRGTILKVAKYLGEDYYKEVSEDEELLANIQHHSSFVFMKSLSEMRVPKNMKTYDEIDLTQKGVFENNELFRTALFFRKGEVGDFKATLKEDQKKRLRIKMEEKFHNTDIMTYWDDLL